MPSVNRVMLIGQLWERPAISKIKHGVTMANFEVTTLSRHGDDDGQMRTLVQRHPCRAHGKLAEFAGCLSPRQIVLIEGRLQTLHAPGATRGVTTIIAGTVLAMGRSAEQLEDGNSHQAATQPALTPRSYTEEGS